MTWTYRQSDGELTHDGEFMGTGYSGMGYGRNNPACEAVPMLGPIPKGRYRIEPARWSKTMGPITMNLDPVGHDACKRSHLRVHGDNKTHDASHGCVILGPSIRRMMADSADRELIVI